MTKRNILIGSPSNPNFAIRLIDKMDRCSSRFQCCQLTFFLESPDTGSIRTYILVIVNKFTLSLMYVIFISFTLGVFIARGKEDALVTKNMVVGESVYGEKRISVDVRACTFCFGTCC